MFSHSHCVIRWCTGWCVESVWDPASSQLTPMFTLEFASNIHQDKCTCIYVSCTNMKIFANSNICFSLHIFSHMYFPHFLNFLQLFHCVVLFILCAYSFIHLLPLPETGPVLMLELVPAVNGADVREHPGWVASSLQGTFTRLKVGEARVPEENPRKHGERM